MRTRILITIITSFALISIVGTNTTALAIDATQLKNEYLTNELAADMKYKGKPITVTGIIREISQLQGMPYVVLYTDNTLNTIICIFSEEKMSNLTHLKKGQKITITGICDGYHPWNVNIIKCDY